MKIILSLLFYRYVQGRPRLLDNELPRIQFLEDRSGSEQRLLSSRMKQEELSNNTQYQIETEVKSLPDLCQLLESVYTAKDFLLEAGGQHDMSLAQFLVGVGFFLSSSDNLLSRQIFTYSTVTHKAPPVVAPSGTCNWLMLMHCSISFSL